MAFFRRWKYILVMVFLTGTAASASASKDWKTILATVGSYAEEMSKSQPDTTAMGNQANLLKFQLEAFLANHPDSKEAWTARFLLPEVKYQAARALHIRVDWHATEREIAEVATDPSLPEKLKGDAEFSRLSFLISQRQQPDFSARDGNRLIAEMEAFLDHYPRHKTAADMALDLGGMLAVSDPGKAREVLQLAKRSRDERKANRAERALAVLPYRTQPLDWKFQGFDGREVDLTELRGKIVVIDFWATWCGPCMREVPRLVGIYQRFHDRGVEFIGISFDDSSTALKQGLETNGMTWPQYFDGRGWGNKIGDKFAIKSIPTMWILDREGRVVTTEAWAGNLEYYFQKLLGQ